MLGSLCRVLHIGCGHNQLILPLHGPGGPMMVARVGMESHCLSPICTWAVHHIPSRRRYARRMDRNETFAGIATSAQCGHARIMDPPPPRENPCQRKDVQARPLRGGLIRWNKQVVRIRQVGFGSRQHGDNCAWVPQGRHEPTNRGEHRVVARVQPSRLPRLVGLCTVT